MAITSVQTSYGTTLTKAIEGALADSGAHDVIVKYNGEASAAIAFGRAVKFGATDNAALLPAAETDKICGIVLHTDQYSTGEGGELKQDGTEWTNGLRPGAVMSVLRKGRIWVKPRTAVTPGDRLWVRAVSAESGVEFLGGLEDADDSTDTIDCTAQGVWLDTAAAGVLARLEVDFTNKP
jgi:hypothetical protein